MVEQTLQPQKACVLVVDDDTDVLAMLDSAIKDYGYDVIKALSGPEGMALAEATPPDLILLDIGMPGMDGYQVCKQLKLNSKLKDIPVIFMSGMDSTDVKVKAFQAGGVDYVTKPFQLPELQARVGTHLNLCSLRYKLEFHKMVGEKVKDVLEAQQATIFALAKLAEHRDCDTGVHLERVKNYCSLIAEQLYRDSPYSSQLSEDFVQCIQFAAPLHDIGKVAIPDSILLKPGKLNDEEFELMKTHAVVGAETLQVVYNKYAGNIFIGMGIEIALYHHERWDGSGYPDGLVGRNIPLSARITALADFYDALCSDRCYRKGFDHDCVKSMILERDGTHFDPEVVKAFIVLEDEFRQIMGTQVLEIGV
jgi:putative two-component system response regulator